MVGFWTPFFSMNCFSGSHANVGDFLCLRDVDVCLCYGGSHVELRSISLVETGISNFQLAGNFLPKYLKIKLRASPGCNSSALSLILFACLNLLPLWLLSFVCLVFKLHNVHHRHFHKIMGVEPVL